MLSGTERSGVSQLNRPATDGRVLQLYGRFARFEGYQSSKMTPVGTLESGKWGKSAIKLHCNDVQIPPHVVNLYDI
jgi:hypothetical protein